MGHCGCVFRGVYVTHELHNAHYARDVHDVNAVHVGGGVYDVVELCAFFTVYRLSIMFVMRMVSIKCVAGPTMSIYFVYDVNTIMICFASRYTMCIRWIWHVCI